MQYVIIIRKKRNPGRITGYPASRNKFRLAVIELEFSATYKRGKRGKSTTRSWCKQHWRPLLLTAKTILHRVFRIRRERGIPCIDQMHLANHCYSRWQIRWNRRPTIGAVAVILLKRVLKRAFSAPFAHFHWLRKQKKQFSMHTAADNRQEVWGLWKPQLTLRVTEPHLPALHHLYGS